MKRNPRGFTLLELLIVVAIIGIIVAISVANFLLAIEKARQRQTMANMRSISTGIETYRIDYNTYPPSAATVLPSGLSLPTDLVKDKLESFISPTYMARMPLTDGWSSWFLYSTTVTSNADFCVASSGRGGVPQAAPAYGPSTNLEDDILMVDGQFVQYPAGGSN